MCKMLEPWHDPEWVQLQTYPLLTWVCQLMMRHPGSADSRIVENIVVNELTRRMTPMDMQAWFDTPSVERNNRA